MVKLSSIPRVPPYLSYILFPAYAPAWYGYLLGMI